jgi:hypothetical protein
MKITVILQFQGEKSMKSATERPALELLRLGSWSLPTQSGLLADPDVGHRRGQSGYA